MKSLLPIYELEVELGNSIASVDSPAGTNCPFAINFTQRLHHEEINKQLKLSPTVERWTNRDKHYPEQSGYFCSKYKHSIAGPL